MRVELKLLIIYLKIGRLSLIISLGLIESQAHLKWKRETEETGTTHSTLLPLRLEERGHWPRKVGHLGNWEKQGSGSYPELQTEAQPCQYSDGSPGRPRSDFQLQNAFYV